MYYFFGRPVRINDKALSLFPLGPYQYSESTGQLAAAPVANRNSSDSEWFSGRTTKLFVVRFRVRTSFLKRVWKIEKSDFCLSSSKILAPTQRIFMKFDI
jgi:hypothetical protein